MHTQAPSHSKTGLGRKEETMVRIVVAGAVLAVLLAITPAASAQAVSVAQLSGTVVDTSGGALPGVEVTITHTGTGATRSQISNERGDYVFANLPVGPYKLSALLSGFSTFEQTGIVLAVGESRSVNVTMALGAITETVSVQADATLVETRSVGVNRVVQEEQIVGLPLDGRNVTQLVVLAGGAVPNVGLTAGDRGYPGQVSIAVSGGTGNSTLYLVDGGFNNDPQANSGNAMPFPDALQEFSVESGVRNARYGMSTGATVNAVTKSGTNLFHGGGFIFARDSRFNAIRYFEKQENGGLGRDDGLSRQQFGGTLGGPILRDRLFFFGGYQGTTTRVTPTTQTVLPTAEMLRGDFRRAMSAQCRGTARTLGFPFVDNQVDPALFHPLALRIASMVPVADPALDPDGCGTQLVPHDNNSTDQQLVTRVDWQMTQNKRVFARDFYSRFVHPAAWDAANPNLLDTLDEGRGNRATQHTIATGLDYVITSNLLSSTRFSYQHTFATREHGAGVPTLADLGVKAWMYTVGRIPGQDMLKNGIWNSEHTGIFYADTPSFSQDFDWNKGNHSLSFGGSWTRPSSDGDGPFQADGQFIFDGLMTSGTANASGGLPLADFLLGFPREYRGGGSQLNNQYIHAVGVYFNDVWRVSSRLTLTGGVRWEPYLAPVDRNNFALHFSREHFENGIRSTVYPNAPLGLMFNGDPGFPTGGKNSFDYLPQVGPRFGAVWDPKGDTVQTLRAGFGIYFDSPKLWTTARHPLNPPFGQRVTALNPGVPGATVTSCPGQPNRNGCPANFLDPWFATPGGDPHTNLARQGEPVVLPDASTRFPLNGGYVSMPLDTKPMRAYQFNVSYQRQLGARMMFDVTYNGNLQRNVWVAGYTENPAVYIPGNCEAGQYALTAPGPCSNTSQANLNARRVLTLLNPVEGQFYQLNELEQMYPHGKGHYNGVKFSLEKRMSNGWSASANYTLSKCINQGEPATDIGTTFPVSQIDPFTNPRPDPDSNKGPCLADRRHLFNLSSVVMTRGLGSGFLDTLTRDWQFGLIFQLRSGAPLTIGVTNNNALTGTEQQRPMIVPGVDPVLDEPVWIPDAAGRNTRLEWINPAAFRNAAPGEMGDAPRGYIYGPKYWNVDLAVSRNINIADGRRIELRVETFNLFNTVNWALGTPANTLLLDNANFGRITQTAGDPRIMQFALKFNF